MDKKYVIEIDRYTRGIYINALNDYRNKLINEDISTEVVDEALLKIINAPLKRRSLSLSKEPKGNFKNYER